MRFKILSICSIIAALFLTACSGDYRELADGNTREMVVVMDSTKWNGEVGEAIRETFGKLVFTLPNPEPNYNLIFRDFRTQTQLDRIKRHKNLLFVATIDEQTGTGNQVRGFLD